jgi:GNAT superfamily N-acetyltransferase
LFIAETVIHNCSKIKSLTLDFFAAFQFSDAARDLVPIMHAEMTRGEFAISTDPARLDLDAIYDFLSKSYWGQNRSRERVETSIKNSFCFGVYSGKSQIGFARLVTDYATFCYLADVYILEPFRRRGLGKWLIDSILGHPQFKHLRRWCLVTRDAQELYIKCGWQPLKNPEQYMELLRPHPQTQT